jgi:hypothetical protein
MLRTLLRSSRLFFGCVIGVVLALALKMYISVGGTFLGFWLPSIFGAGWWIYLCRPRAEHLSRQARTAFLVLFLAALVPLGLPWDSRERFLRDLSRVDRGMTPEQVEAILGPYLSGSGWPGNPFTSPSSSGEFRIEGCKIFRHCDDCGYASDWGIVCFDDGLVSSVRFSPD